MTEKKQSAASARKALQSLASWDDLYTKTSKKKLVTLGLEKRSLLDVVAEMSLLRSMIVKDEHVISSIMRVRNVLSSDRLDAIKYGIQRMTPQVIDPGIGSDLVGCIGGTDAFRPLPNRSVKENASGSNRQLGVMRMDYTDGTCPRCEKEIGLDVVHWKGGRSSLCCSHVIPESFGGCTNNKNVVVSCAECNYQRGNWVDTLTLSRLRQITIIVPIHVTHPK